MPDKYIERIREFMMDLSYLHERGKTYGRLSL